MRVTCLGLGRWVAARPAGEDDAAVLGHVADEGEAHSW